jgi:hypothetical protein
MKKKNQLQVHKEIDNILGGKAEMAPNEKGEMHKVADHPNYTAAKAIQTVDYEEFNVTNPITGKVSLVKLSRTGTTAEKLAMVLLSPDATKEQKDSWLSNYLFERGKENSSFLAELYISKGTAIKEIQGFKRQMRFDFEAFANTMVLLLQDLADDIKRTRMHGSVNTFDTIAERFDKGAILIRKEINAITEARERDKGKGVYLDASGKAYTLYDGDIVDVVKKDREDLIKFNEEQSHE